MVFSFYSTHQNTFEVNQEQKYKIYTTTKEVQVLNEALNIYQSDGFKNSYLLFEEEIDGSKKYPDFLPYFKKSQEIAKVLQGLAQDEDSLVQLNEYCLEIAPTYLDDFMLNKKIESIIIDREEKEIKGYEDLKAILFDK